MEQENLKMCHIWSSGSNQIDLRTKEQLHAEEVRKRWDLYERYNKALNNYDITKEGTINYDNQIRK